MAEDPLAAFPDGQGAGEGELADDGTALQDVMKILEAGGEGLPGEEAEVKEEKPVVKEPLAELKEPSEEEIPEDEIVEEEPEEEVEEEEVEEEPAAGGEAPLTADEFLNRLEVLQQENARLTGLVSATPTGPAPVVPDVPKEQPFPDYMFNIPSNMMEGLAAEELPERTRAMQLLLQAASTAVHKSIREEMHSELKLHGQTLIENIDSANAQREHSRTIAQDFYGTYPELDRPIFRRVVDSVQSRVQASRTDATWNPKLRDAIAKEAIREIKSQTGVELKLGKKVARPRPPGKKAPRIVKKGTRGVADPRTSIAKDIVSLRDGTEF